jgi:uncharacterized protein (DUF58 family)
MEGPSILTKRTVLIGFTVLFFFIAWNRDIYLLYGMFALLSSTLVVSFAVPRLALKSVSAARTVSHRSAFEDDVLEIRTVIENTGHRSKFMIEVVDSIPAADPSLRNPMTFVAKIPAGGRKEYSLDFSCYKRGLYTFGPLSVCSAYPLGITSVSKQVPDSMPTLIVYPRIFEIARVPLIFKGSRIQSGVEALARTGGSGEFYGTREYKMGDSLRHIHWPLSAKHGRLIVKEFEMRGSTQVSVLLDLDHTSNMGQGRDSTFEYSVKIAASLGKYALERGHYYQLLGFDGTDQIHCASSRPDDLAGILDSLARVNDNGTMSYPDAITAASAALIDGSTIVLFFNRWENDEAYSYALRLLETRRIGIVAFFFNGESFNGRTPGEGWMEKSLLAGRLLSMGAVCYGISKGESLPEVFAA